MPTHHGLDNAERLDNFMLSSLLIGKQLLCGIMSEVHDYSPGQKRKDCILLQLISHDGST
jgi:hypothetical protein